MSRAFVRASTQLAAGQVALLVSSAAMSLLAARWLGPTGKGQLALAVAMGALLGPIAAMGTDTYIAARWPSIPAPERHAVRQLAVWRGWTGAVVLAALTVSFGLVNGLGVALIAAAAAAAALRPPMSVAQALLISHNRVPDLGRLSAVMAFAQIAFLAPFAWAGVSASHFALAAAAALVLGLVLARHPVGRAGGQRHASRKLRRDVRRFGITVVLADGLQAASYRIDVVILALFVPVPEIGVYSVAVLLAEVLWQVPNALARTLLARLSVSEVSRRHVVSIALRLGALLAGLAAVGVISTAVLLPVVLGPAYSDALVVLCLLLPGIIVLGAAKPLAAWTLSGGYATRNLWASALGFGVAVAADAALIPWLGIRGAALASSLSYLVTAVAIVRMLPPDVSPPAEPLSPAACPASS